MSPLTRKASLVGIARGAGIEKGIEVRTQDELERAVDRILGEDGPFIVVVKVDKGPTTAPFDQDLIGQATRFRKALAAVGVRSCNTTFRRRMYERKT